MWDTINWMKKNKAENSPSGTNMKPREPKAKRAFLDAAKKKESEL